MPQTARGLDLATADLYSVLGVECRATFAEIRTAYKRAALHAHPDKGGNSSTFQRVTMAFETLSNETSRASYDRRRRQCHQMWQQQRRQNFWAAGAAVATSPRPTRAEKAGRKQAGGSADGGFQRRQEQQQQGEPQRQDGNDAGGCFSTGRRAGTAPAQGTGAASAAADPTAANRTGEAGGTGTAHQNDSGESCCVGVALHRLWTALQALPIDSRRAQIAALDATIRSKLLEYMLAAQGPQAPETPLAVRTVAPEPDDSTSETDIGSEDADTLLALEDGAGDEEEEIPGEQSAGVRQGKSGRSGTPSGVETWSGFKKQQRARGKPSESMYRACLSFANLRLHTRFQKHLDVAVEAHITLALVRRAVLGSKMLRDKAGAVQSDTVRKAFHTVCAERGTSAEAMGLTVATRMVLRDRRSSKVMSQGGRMDITVTTPTFNSLDEALLWRERLLKARVEGWQPFRAVWVDLLQHRGYTRRAPLTEAEAVAHVDKVWNDGLSVHWQRIESRRRQRCCADTHQHKGESAPIRRVLRAARAVQRRLDAAARRAQLRATREERKAQQLRRRLAVARRRWFRRPDATVAEMLRGFPPHLQHPRNPG